MRKIRKKLLLYGLVAVFLLSVMSVAMADTEENSAPDAEQQITSVFKDVTSSDSNLIYINYLAKREIISGFPDGGFHPAEGLSRAQAATLLVKAAGLEPADVKTSVFKDVEPSHWAAGNIAAASAAGYLKGYPDGNYHPEEKLSRAQGISLVLRLSQQEDPGVELPQLKDMDNNHWAARSAAIGLAAGMVGLTADQTQFLPDGDFTRGDLSRALAVLLTTDPGLNRVELDGSLEVKAGTVKVNDQTIEKSTAIKAGDIITTSAKAEAQLSYPDGSGLLIKELTTLEVKETRGTSYIKSDGSPGTGVDWLLVDLKKGEVFGALATNPNIKEEENREKETAGSQLLAGLSGGLNLLALEDKAPPWYQAANQKKVKVEVDMPWGVAAIRGSFWSNLVTGTGCDTTLLEGEAEVSAGGQSQPLTPGSSSTTSPGAPPTPPAPMTPQQVSQWGQQSAWLQNVAQQIQANQPASQPPAGITGPSQPGQPAPPAGNLLDSLNQALIQAQQQAGLPTQGLNTPPGTTTPGPSPDPNPNPDPDSGSGSATVTLWTESFEGDMSGWELNTGGQGLWNVISNDSGIKNGAVGKYVRLPEGDASEGSLPATASGSKCLWYGKTSSTNPYEVGNYLKQQVSDDGQMGGGRSVSAHSDSVVSPAITIPATVNREFILSFNSWWEIEAVNPSGFDMMKVYVVDGEESILLDVLNPRYSYSQGPNYAPVAFTSGGLDTSGVWKTYWYNLSEYSGKTIKLKFEFNTVDTNYNAFRGWFIDAIKVARMASNPGSIAGKIMDYADDAAVQNVTLKLMDGDNEIATATSGSDGAYLFSAIDPGNYEVKVLPPFGYAPSYDLSAAVAVIPGQTTSGVDFYLQELTPGIINISTNPENCTYSDQDQSINVTVLTSAIAQGITIAVQLLDADEDPVENASASATVGSDNTASANLTIPAGTAAGTYFIRASVNEYSFYKMFAIQAGSTDEWESLGSPGISSTGSELGLTVGANPANLYVAFVNDISQVEVRDVLAGWSLLGSPLNTSGGIVDLSLQNDVPVVAYVYESIPIVAGYNGSWTPLSGLDAPSEAVTSLSLDGGGVEPYSPYLACKHGSSISVYAYVYDNEYGWGWQPRGDGISGANPSGTININAAGGTPYLAYEGASGVKVRKYDGSYWPDIGSWSSTSSPALAVNRYNSPETLYVAYRDNTTSGANRGTVMRGMYYGGPSWDWADLLGPLDPLYFSEGEADNISLAWYGSYLYVAYSDEGQEGKLVVKYFNGSEWIPIEIEGWGQDSVEETRLRVTSDGVYVLYRVGSGNVTLLKHSLPIPPGLT